VTVCRNRGWKYALLALIDVEANFLVVKAYQYTNLISIQVWTVHKPKEIELNCVCMYN